jgi:coenzyme F420-reducing hydrogenase delta subunit/ferredoxin
VFHGDDIKPFEIKAQSVIQCIDLDSDSIRDQFVAWERNGDDITTISSGFESGLADRLNTAMASAVSTAIDIKSRGSFVTESIEKIDDQRRFLPDAFEPANGNRRTGVFLCRCGDSVSDIIDFSEVAKAILSVNDVVFIDETSQACTVEGATRIALKASEAQLSNLVIAACRCCNLEQVCYSCSDRRVMCQQHLTDQMQIHGNIYLEFVNIREHCAWVHKDDGQGATQKAIKLISAGITNAENASPVLRTKTLVTPGVLVVGGGRASSIAAQALVAQGYKVQLITKQYKDYDNSHIEKFFTRNDIEISNLIIKPWPINLEVSGIPGRYEVTLDGNLISDSVGSVLIDVEEVKKNPLSTLGGSSGNIFGRMVARMNNIESNAGTSDLLREITLGETTGLFLLLPSQDSSDEAEDIRGLATAARISSYLAKRNVMTRAMAVDIDIKACRGCGDCAAVCRYIEMRERENGIPYAFVDKALCIGCGLCVSLCDTGAIIQPAQGDNQIKLALNAILAEGQSAFRKKKDSADFNIVVFACNWDGWSCLEAVSYMGLSYTTLIRPIRVRCLSRVHAGLILKAFELGAEGVLLVGCETGNCHFNNDNECILGEYQKSRRLMEMLGIEKERLVLTQLSAFDGHGFVDQITKLTAMLRAAQKGRYNLASSSTARRKSKVKSSS